MARITLEFTQDHISLIRNLNFQRLTDTVSGIDTYDLYGGTYKYEQMAYILGLADKIIADTAESIYGPRYEEETQKYLMDIDAFIVEHLTDIEEILHQFCDTGIQPGKYTAKDNEHIWKRVE